MTGELIRMRYEIGDKIESGPLFDTYRAKDRSSAKGYVIRFLLPQFKSEPGFVEKLRVAIRELSVIRHASVERFIEMGDHEGQPYILSEAPLGQSLEDRIKRLAPYSVPVCISICIQILDALSAIHMAGFTHGEVTAKHVSVGQDGRPTILQPGLWTTYGASHSAGASVLPDLAPYLAPEVAQGKMPSATSDVYGVGVILFELLTARQPFSGDTAASIAQKHLTAPIPSPRQLNQSCPPALEELLKKAMTKDTAHRYTNAKDMMSDLRVMQDAIRFGKPLQWPVRGESGPSTPSAKTYLAPAPATPAAGVIAASAGTATGATAATVGAAASATGAATTSTAVAPAIDMSKQAEKAKQTEAKKKREKVESEFNNSLPPFISWISYLAVIALIGMVAGWIYWNLTKPKPIQVPNLVGMRASDAKQKLDDIGITLRVKRQDYSTKPEGTILELDPKPGEDVREHSSVSAVVSAGPKIVPVPDLRGRTMDEARKLLNSLDLILDETPDEDVSSRFPKGTIISQLPEARTKVDRRTKVKITVASNRERSDPNRRVRAQYELIIRMPNELTDPVFVRVDIVDIEGTRTIYPETKHAANDSFLVSDTARGGEVIFKVFFNGTMVKQVNAQPTDVGEEKKY